MKIFFSIILLGILLTSCGKKIDIEGSIRDKEKSKGNILISYTKLEEKETEAAYVYYYQAEVAGNNAIIRDSIIFHTTGDNIWTPIDHF